MEGAMSIDLDKLPIRRLESIQESGSEHFAPEVGPDEKQLHLIRRIDFSTVVEEGDKKRAKTSEKEKKEVGPWPWQSLVENLQQAQQELSVILDLINTVEGNDAVTVAGMTRPKPLPNEVLSDISVSAATKLQKFRHLSKYFKQSSKAFEKQVAKETRFYGALIRLQQNWKVKRQRLGASGPGSEGFIFDLLDNMSSDAAPFSRSYSMSTVRINQDSDGKLAVQFPSRSCRFLHFGFVQNSGGTPNYSTKKKICKSRKCLPLEDNKEDSEEDVNECVKVSHSVLREIHEAIFDEQAFDLVSRETFNPLSGFNIIGMKEDFFQLGIGQEASVVLHLLPAEQDDDTQETESGLQFNGSKNGIPHKKLSIAVEEKYDISRKNMTAFPDPECFKIYLSHILHENMLNKAMERRVATKSHVLGQPQGDDSGVLSHFCMTLAHRIFSGKVLSALENLASGASYLHLLTHPTWHSRMSSWSLSIKVPQSILHAGQQQKPSDPHETKDGIRMQFRTVVVVTDEYISVSGEGAPSVMGSFGGNSMDLRPPNSYGCDLVHLPVILLQQVASQVIHWLHEEALVIGMKASRDYLSLFFDLEEGNKIGLAACVDPHDIYGCISWWLIMDDGLMVEGKPRTKLTTLESENRKFLGHLPLEALYTILMDLISLCSCGGSR